MSDEQPAAESEPGTRRRFHLWPRTVRWRLTLVSALVFAIAFMVCARRPISSSVPGSGTRR